MLNRGLDKLELLRIVDAVANEKSIDKELVIGSMESAIQKAALTKFGNDNTIEVKIDRESGEISIQKVLDIVKHFFDENKPVGSVCHGVEIPAFADCVRGRRMATVPKCRFDLEVCGGIFVDEPCVIDGNLISGRTYHDNGHFVGPWISLLEKAREHNMG